jgi:ABC-type branched-subunit amino acid transport system ATPase component
MLSVRALQGGYGDSQVLFDVSFEIAAGEIVTLLGRNGMGKTTTVRAVMGLVAPTGGEIVLDAAPLRGLTPEAIARRGLGLAPEGRQVFPTTVSVATRPGRSSASMRCSRVFRSASSNMRARCRAASSRCWRSAGR